LRRRIRLESKTLMQLLAATMRPARLIVLVTLAILASGCGSGLAPISGQLKWKDGSPAKELAGGQVVFEQEEKRTSSIGVIQAEGTFQMMTVNPGDGVPVGHHKVAILEHRPNANAAGTQLVPARLDLKYADLNSSGLEVDVKPGKNEISFTLDRAAAR
jgi:predicted lysophospholipase L1 biosynthesis ABC-type transport system permease subunit